VASTGSSVKLSARMLQRPASRQGSENGGCLRGLRCAGRRWVQHPALSAVGGARNRICRVPTRTRPRHRADGGGAEAAGRCLGLLQDGRGFPSHFCVL